MSSEWRRREEALYDLLKKAPSAPLVVIGGYAVSAWTVPRYSVDIDLVVPGASEAPIHSWLADHGLSVVTSRPEIEQNYGGSWERWQGGALGVTVDVLLKSVQDRRFEVPLPFEHVARGAQELEIRGVTRSGVRLSVAARETLIALKMQPMRPTDVGDVACLAHAGYNERTLRRQAGPVVRARPQLVLESLARLEAVVGGDEQEAQLRLGPRVPGKAQQRFPVVRAARRLSAFIRKMVGDASLPSAEDGRERNDREDGRD